MNLLFSRVYVEVNDFGFMIVQHSLLAYLCCLDYVRCFGSFILVVLYCSELCEEFCSSSCSARVLSSLSLKYMNCLNKPVFVLSYLISV